MLWVAQAPSPVRSLRKGGRAGATYISFQLKYAVIPQPMAITM